MLIRVYAHLSRHDKPSGNLHVHCVSSKVKRSVKLYRKTEYEEHTSQINKTPIALRQEQYICIDGQKFSCWLRNIFQTTCGDILQSKNPE